MHFDFNKVARILQRDFVKDYLRFKLLLLFALRFSFSGESPQASKMAEANTELAI